MDNPLSPERGRVGRESRKRAAFDGVPFLYPSPFEACFRDLSLSVARAIYFSESSHWIMMPVMVDNGGSVLANTLEKRVRRVSHESRRARLEIP
jgi:hypothetical protein